MVPTNLFFFFFFYSSSLHRFGNSKNLMFGFEGSFQISFNNGKNWQKVNLSDQDPRDADVEDLSRVRADQFYKERAFATKASGKKKKKITEDKGRNWGQISVPEEFYNEGMRFIKTHPSNRHLLLLECEIIRENSLDSGQGTNTPVFLEAVAYISNDSGESFRPIVAPIDGLNTTQNLKYRGTTCKFATSSRDSTLAEDGVYCIHELEHISNTKEWSKTGYDINEERKNVQTTKQYPSSQYHIQWVIYFT